MKRRWRLSGIQAGLMFRNFRSLSWTGVPPAAGTTINKLGARLPSTVLPAT